MAAILEVRNAEKYYGNRSNLTKAIDQLSLLFRLVIMIIGISELFLSWRHI